MGGSTLNRTVKLFFLSLLIISILIQGYSIFSYATNIKEDRFQHYCYIVESLDYVPKKYWDLTDPDPYILEAIENPGEWTEPFYREDSTFWFTAIWDDNPGLPGPRILKSVPFKYNGTYYNYDVVYPGERLVVTALHETPEEYWNLTDTDKYLMRAIENPGELIVVGIDSRAREILSPYSFPSTYKPFQYNGTFYDFSMEDADYGYPLPIPQRPELTASILGGMWITIGSIYILKTRKTKIEH
jgi:hypothetical protein